MFDKLISIRIHGKGSSKYENIRIGVNGRLDTIQAAILLAKFILFDEEIELRQLVAERYNQKLKNYVKVPFVENHSISAWAQYSVRHSGRDMIIENLKKEGIPSAIYYPIPLHLQRAISHLGYQAGDFPVSEKTSEAIFSLPFYPYLKNDDQDKIIEVIIKSST